MKLELRVREEPAVRKLKPKGESSCFYFRKKMPLLASILYESNEGMVKKSTEWLGTNAAAVPACD